MVKEEKKRKKKTRHVEEEDNHKDFSENKEKRMKIRHVEEEENHKDFSENNEKRMKIRHVEEEEDQKKCKKKTKHVEEEENHKDFSENKEKRMKLRHVEEEEDQKKCKKKTNLVEEEENHKDYSENKEKRMKIRHVEEEEDQKKCKKKTKHVEEEEDHKERKKKKRYVEEEDQKKRKKKTRHVEEEEDQKKHKKKTRHVEEEEDQKKRKKKTRHVEEEEDQKNVSENKDKMMEKIKDFQVKSDKKVKDIGDAMEISDEEFFNALASDTSSSNDDSDEGDEKDSKPHKKQMLLHWMKKPLDINLFNGCPLCMLPCLDPRLEDTLRKMGFDSLFPVQLAVWHMTVGPGGFERDICVNSPTGSGKTLAYALPIVQMLSTRNIRCLRALIVVPTRDLAIQVKQVFDIIAPAVGLCVGLAVGQSSIEKEFSCLIKRPKFEMGMSFDPEDSRVELQSLVDILVATPGRLVDHINTTKGFSLEHLQYLVVDEVDRLVGESYQFWLPAVLQVSRSAQKRLFKQASVHNSLRTIRRCGVERGFKDNMYPRLVKMIFSATLTKDPNKLDQLDLHHSLYMTAGDRRYNLPKKLESYGLICTAEKKLLNLAALLEDLGCEKSIVFTSSINLTHRLCTSLNLLGCLPCKINEYSRLQNQSVRSKTLKDFREGRIDVLVSSDGMTRGMDVEGIKNVINYDLPMYVKKYIHRAGRTARAEQAGRCFTLLRKNETKSFKNMLEKVGIDCFSSYTFPAASLQRLEPLCITAMEKLIELEEIKSSKQIEARPKFNKVKQSKA